MQEEETVVIWALQYTKGIVRYKAVLGMETTPNGRHLVFLAASPAEGEYKLERARVQILRQPWGERIVLILDHRNKIGNYSK